MLNLFSMLSRAKVRSCQNEDDNELQDLREQLELTKSQIHKLNLTIVDMHDSVAELKRKVKEISTVNDIILSVQQSLLEELAFAAQHAQQQQKKVVSIFPVAGNDDDDLPN